jgi:hypothetical protein
MGSRSLLASLLGVLLIASAEGSRSDEGASTDPLAAEIARWSSFLRDLTPSDENSKSVKQSVEPALARVEAALRDGRRYLALERLAATRPNVAGLAYVAALPANASSDAAKLEFEWKRLGAALSKELAGPSASTLQGVQPAAVRAEGEAALPQVRNYYESSLQYAQATSSWEGFFYLGVAAGQRDFVDFCRRLSAPTKLAPPPVRSIATELDALEADLLRAYRPPASIDRHAEFIGASAALKEARELDAAGLRYGALLRYLQAAMRLGPLRAGAPKPDVAALRAQLEPFESRLTQGGVDHSIGRIYLESAQAHLVDDGSPGVNPSLAEAIVHEVLPRYFAALAPAAPMPARPAPSITVTLVRWPYT